MILKTRPLLQRWERTLAFSLIEILICVSIISIVFVSLYAGITNGFAIARVSHEKLRATQIALEKMETIRLYNWDQINSNGFIPTNFTAYFIPADSVLFTNLNDGSVSQQLGQGRGVAYKGQILITTNVGWNNSYSNTMRKVTITLSWTNGSIVRTQQMTTLVSQYGVQNYVYW